MSNPASSAGNIIKALEEVKDLLNKMDVKLNTLTKEVADLKESGRTDNDLVQTNLEIIKASLGQVMATQASAKKPVKNVENKTPTEESVKETKETKETKSTKKKETPNAFFLRRSKECSEFKAKYDNDEIRNAYKGDKKVLCPALHALNTDAYKALKEEFEKEHKASE